jgi:MFS family permease
MAKDRYKWYVVGMLWCISFFNYADREAIFSLFPLLQKEMALTPVELGLLGSAFAWVYGLSSPFAGSIVDRIRRKTAILGGLYGWSTIAILTPLARTFHQLLSFMAADGIGETFYYPASMSMISDYHGKTTRSRAMGIHQTSVYMGTVVGAFFAALIGEHYGWRWSFLVFGGAGVLLGSALLGALREPQRGAADRMEKTCCEVPRKRELSVARFLVIVGKTPSVALLMGGFVCADFVALVLLSWMPKFLYDRFHLSLAMAGLSATLFAQMASLVGSPVGGWLADLMRAKLAGGRMLVQAFALICGAPFVFLCGKTKSIEWVVIVLTAWGFLKGLYDANIFASVYDVIPIETRGTAAGYMNMVGWLGGGGAAPLAVGLLAERYSLSLAISLASLVYLAGPVLLFLAGIRFAPGDVARTERVIVTDCQH